MSSTITAPALSYVILHVADLAAASAYYTDTLGFVPNAEFGGPDFREFTTQVPGGIPFAIAQADERNTAGSAALYFYTDDIEAVRAAYTGKGVEAGATTQMPFGTVFTLPAADGPAHLVMQTPA